MSGKNRIFISYSRQNLQQARKLYQQLKAAGFSPWLDKEDLLPGQRWGPVIRKAIRESRFFLAILSSQSVNRRGYVHRELKLGLETLGEYPEEDVYLIPVRLDPCTVANSALEELHWVDMFPDWDSGFQKVVDSLRLNMEGVDRDSGSPQASPPPENVLGSKENHPKETQSEEAQSEQAQSEQAQSKEAPSNEAPSKEPDAKSGRSKKPISYAVPAAKLTYDEPSTEKKDPPEPTTTPALNSVDVFTKAFSGLHGAWLAKPMRAGLYGFIVFLGVCILSYLLDIHWQIEYQGSIHDGFIRSINWGPLFLIVVPVCAMFAPYFLRQEQLALKSLDRILLPTNGNHFSYTEVFAARFRRAWPLIILPLSLALPIGLTVLADYPDIFAPILGTSSSDKDWSNIGYLANDQWPDWVFLIFNMLAFGSQAFAAYCGFLVLTCTAYLMVTFTGYALSHPELMREESVARPKTIEEVDFRQHFQIVWDYKDPSGRCGLHHFDKVYLFFVGVILIAVGASVVSVWYNKLFSDSGIDPGSLILAICTLFLIPMVFFWIIVPYWTKFPSALPAKYKDQGLADPKPWPFGSEKLTLVVLGFAVSAWITLAKLAVEGLKEMLSK